MILAERTSCFSWNTSPEAFDEICGKHDIGELIAVFVPIFLIFSSFKDSNSLFVYRATQGDVGLFADSNSNSDLMISIKLVFRNTSLTKTINHKLEKTRERRLVRYVLNKTSSLFYILAIIRQTIERIYSMFASVLRIIL